MSIRMYDDTVAIGNGTDAALKGVVLEEAHHTKSMGAINSKQYCIRGRGIVNTRKYTAHASYTTFNQMQFYAVQRRWAIPFSIACHAA